MRERFTAEKCDAFDAWGGQNVGGELSYWGQGGFAKFQQARVAAARASHRTGLHTQNRKMRAGPFRYGARDTRGQIQHSSGP